MWTSIAYVPRLGIRAVDKPDDMPEILADRSNVLWVDLERPKSEDFDLLRTVFGFHELALEDAILTGQRPKLDSYDDFHFIVMYAVAIAEGRLVTCEIHLFVGANFVVSVHNEPVVELAEARSRWQQSRGASDHSAGTLIYSIIDSIVDRYFTEIRA